jgi:hypothetical protein
LANIAVSAANAADLSAARLSKHPIPIDPKVATDYFHAELGEPRQGAERPTSA